MARWIDLDRLLRRDGAIRLPVSSADVNHEPESVKSPLANDDHDQLPFVPDADEAAKQGYTSASASHFVSFRARSFQPLLAGANLLFESLWCVLLFPREHPRGS